MKESKRTEGEWVVTEQLNDKYDNDNICGIKSEADNMIVAEICDVCDGDDTNQANADFIVKAVNNHDGLVEAINKAYEFINYTTTSTDPLDIKAILKILTTALKEVEGEK